MIAPLTDDTAVSCWDMETLTEWKSVEQVLLWYDESSPATCPICLDAFRAPKITRCGHIFCWPCILRYLSLSDKYWRRCPMCFDAVQKGQLRSVRLESVQLPPRVETDATFQFLQRPKASLFPHLRGNEKLTLPRKRVRKIPTVYDDEAKFACILESTREYVMHLAMSELRDLEALDAECRSSGDMDSLPFVEEAMKATSGRLTGYEREEATADDATATANGYQQLEGLGPNDFYSFYQLDNGCYVVLHPLNMKCLAKEFGGERERKPSTDEGGDAIAAGAAAATLQDAWTGASSPPASGRGDGAAHAIAYERLPDVIQARVLDVEHLVMDEEMQKRYRFLSHLPKFCDFYVCELDLSPLLSPETMKAFRADLKKREKQRKAKKEKRGRKPDGTTSSPTSPVFRQFVMPGFSLDDGGAHWPAPAELSLADAFHDGVQLSGSTSSDDVLTASSVTSPSFGPFTSDEDASFATITRNSGYYPPLGAAIHAEPAPATSTWGSSSSLSFSSPPLAPRGGKKKGAKGTPLFSTTQRRSYR